MNTARYAFPVIKADPTAAGRDRVREVCGTSFPIGAGLFLTAAHVLEAAFELKMPCVGVKQDGFLALKPIGKHEIFKELDAAIFVADVPDAAKLLWVLDECELLRDVNVAGFPHGYDRARSMVMSRSFKGYVVANAAHPILPSGCECYELSFACPRGLSGAALFSWEPGVKIAGMILGNSTIEIPVLAEKEISEEGGVINNYEKYESMHLGLALKASELTRLNSTILGDDLLSFLRTHNRVVTKTGDIA